jgi:hypothetical protein
MFITEQEARRRLNSAKNLANSLSSSGVKPENGSVKLSDPLRTEAKNQKISATSHTPVLNENRESRENRESIFKESISKEISKENISKENNDKLKIIAKSLAAQGVPDNTISTELNISRKDIISPESKEVSKRVRANMDRIHDLATDRLMIALGLMTQDKFEDAILRDLNGSVVALSKVIEQTRPREEDEKIGVQFIVHAPESKKLKQYNIIDV